MKKKRKIIEIDEEKCTGCGACIIACAEGALEIVDGKAKLVSDIYCDGLGACLGECPEDALRIVEREAEDFDERAVHERLSEQPSPSQAEPEPLACGCPGSAARTLSTGLADTGATGSARPSMLGHWPVKIQLLNPSAPFLQGADLYVAADCAGFAYPQLHEKVLAGHAVAIGCPKLDDLEAHTERLSQIFAEAKPRSVTVVRMEVPCCGGLEWAVQEAKKRCGSDVPTGTIVVGIDGKVLAESPARAAERKVG